MEILKNYELKKKIAQVYQVDGESGMRIWDYIWNRWFIIDNPDIYIDTGRYTIDQIWKLKDEFTKIMEKIISMSPWELVEKLKQNPPNWTWMTSNVESVIQTFIH